MAEFAEYQHNNMENILHRNYGVELFPNSNSTPVIKKNTPTEALTKFKKLLRNNGFAFLAGKIIVLIFFLYYGNSSTIDYKY